MSDKEAKKKEKADQKAAAKALKKADKEKKKEQLLLEKERKKRAGFFAAKRSSTNNSVTNNNGRLPPKERFVRRWLVINSHSLHLAPASGGKPLSALERALMSRPGEQELLAKGVIKATRNSMSPTTTISFCHPTRLTIFSPSPSVPVFGVPLPHVMYITYTQFQLPLPVLHACEFLRSGNGIPPPLPPPPPNPPSSEDWG